jgi:hypothetical protein
VEELPNAELDVAADRGHIDLIDAAFDDAVDSVHPRR